MSITSGIVSIEDGTKKTEEYAPARKVRVELHFDVPEGHNGQKYLDAATTMANIPRMNDTGPCQSATIDPIPPPT